MINFISINTFSTIPVIRYLFESLAKISPISVIHCHLETQPLNVTATIKEKVIGQFANGSAFNSQSFWFKIYKYLRIYMEIVLISLRRNQIVVSQDYQVISFILANHYLLSIFHTKLIYYQFELVDYDLIHERDKRRIKAIGAHVQNLDIAIFPELNRLHYFCELTGLKQERTLIIPNTCKLPESGMTFRGDILDRISPNAIVFGHVGNVGPDHYLKQFLLAVDQLVRPDVYFIMVGRQSPEVSTLLMAVKNPNFIVMGEVPHTELKNIYPVINYGLILYKAVDKNFEYCAPNKLYEYWSYGIPVIAHKVAGLIPVINMPFLGQTINFENNELIESLQSLLNTPLPDRNYIQRYFDKHLGIDSYINQFTERLESI